MPIMPWQFGRIASVVITIHVAATISAAYLKNIIDFPFPVSDASNGRDTPMGHMDRYSNRTLVVLMGNLRGGEIAWSTLYENVLDLNQADLALIIGRKPPENKTSSLYNRAKYVWEFDEYNDWGDAMDLINGTGWRATLPGLLPPVSNLLGGMKLPNTESRGSGAIILMIRYFLSREIQRLGLIKKYDRFVVTRSDHYYLCKHNLSLLSPEYLWLPNGEDNLGITDRHLVVSSKYVLDALDILPGLLKDPQRYQDDVKDTWDNPEKMIKKRWEAMGLFAKVRRFPRMMFTCAVEGDTTRWSIMTPYTVPEGVHLKYIHEYKDSHKTCNGRNVTLAVQASSVRVSASSGTAQVKGSLLKNAKNGASIVVKVGS